MLFPTPGPAGSALPPLVAALILATLSAGRADAETPLWNGHPPVVAKVQIVFSVVTHYNSIADRVSFYNSQGSPAGNQNYVVPHLVYEPLVTLYNPYNFTISAPRSRIVISDPPVGFKFKKNDTYLRPDFAQPEGYLGLARFMIADESNASARKTLTLLLRQPLPTGAPGAPITLLPGESKTFAAWVEPGWTWGSETATPFQPHAFHDWSSEQNVANRDRRTANALGVEAVPGWDPRAGFQADHLSVRPRPAATLYGFENNGGLLPGGWVAIKNTDTFSVEAKGMRTVADPGAPDFRVDHLKGQVADASLDPGRKYAVSLTSSSPAVQRTFLAGNLIQTPADSSPGGKSPFAMLTMVAKAAALGANHFYSIPELPGDSLYELHFGEILEFSQIETVRSSDALQEGFRIHRIERIGDTVFLDVAVGTNISVLRIKGTSSLEAGFTDDLSSLTQDIPGPEGSGLFKVMVNVAGKGPRYFIRLEDGATNP